MSRQPDEPATDSAPPNDGGITVTIDRRSLIGLLLLNVLLTVLTLGIYRFWARTKVRQRLWSAVSLQGESFAYTGTGKELFIGFLVALVVLLPFGIIVSIVNGLIPPTDIGARLLFQLLVGLGAGLLGLMALYFARRYLLTRTRWRGIYGGQDKGLGAFMLLHLKAYIPSMLTLGLAQPWADAKTYNYRTGITWFGTEKFSARATTSGLWSIYLPGWLLLVGGYGLLFAGTIPFLAWSAEAQQNAANGLAAGGPPTPQIGLLVASMVSMLAGSVVLFLYAIRRTTLFIGATSLGKMAFDLPLPVGKLLYIPLIGAALFIISVSVSAVLFTGIAKIVGYGPFVLVLTSLLLLMALLFITSVISVAWVKVEVLRKVGQYLRLHNVGVLDDILNRGQPAPTRGEGLADAIGDIGIGG